MVAEGGATVRVMAGESCGATGPIAMRNPGMLLDVSLASGAYFSQQARCLAMGWLAEWRRRDGPHCNFV